MHASACKWLASEDALLVKQDLSQVTYAEWTGGCAGGMLGENIGSMCVTLAVCTPVLASDMLLVKQC